MEIKCSKHIDMIVNLILKRVRLVLYLEIISRIFDFRDITVWPGKGPTVRQKNPG